MGWGIPEGMAHYMADDMKYGAIESMTWDEFYEKYSKYGVSKITLKSNKWPKYFTQNPYYLEFAFAIIHDLPIEPPQPTSLGLINWAFLLPDYTDQYDEAYKEFDFTAKAKGDKRYQYDDYRKWWDNQQEEDKRKKRYPSPYDWNTQKSRRQYDYHLRDQYLHSYAQK